MKAQQLESEQKQRVIVDAAEDKKANYVTTLDLQGRTVITDYFVICSGTSNVHIRSIADGIIEAMERRGIRASALEGYAEGAWVLLDYGDVVTHIMSEEHRSYYKLERLWGSPEAEPPGVDDDELAADADDDLNGDYDESAIADDTSGDLDRTDAPSAQPAILAAAASGSRE